MTVPTDVTTRAGGMARGADLGWVADALVGRREEILRRWRSAAEEQPFHKGRPALAVADHIPALFDAILDLLQRTAPQTTPSESPLLDPRVVEEAREHARVRFEQGLSAENVVTEFRLLRQEVGRAIRAEVDDAAPPGDVVAAELLVHDALDGAIALALTALSVRVEEMREEFLATTVHDVQQPISAIKGNVQIALRQLDRPTPDLEKMAVVLRRAEDALNRMTVLLRTLSDASRLSLGRLDLRLVEADLGRLVHDYIERLGADESDRMRIEIAPHADLSGRWDAELLERVIANLVSNALKFSPADRPVCVLLSSAADSVRMSVADQGIGVEADELQNLFRRYGRTHAAVDADIQGDGLGLFLCKGIIEAHSGRIWADSPGAGQGTTVHVVLPRGASIPNQDADAAPPERVQSGIGVDATR